MISFRQVFLLCVVGMGVGSIYLTHSAQNKIRKYTALHRSEAWEKPKPESQEWQDSAYCIPMIGLGRAYSPLLGWQLPDGEVVADANTRESPDHNFYLCRLHYNRDGGVLLFVPKQGS
jgi:hypothetical protein